MCVLNIYSRPSRFQYPLSAENDVIRDESPFNHCNNEKMLVSTKSICDAFSFSCVNTLMAFLTLSLQGGDDDGQDPQGECEAGQGQVQDPAGGEEGQHKEEGGSVREHVS